MRTFKRSKKVRNFLAGGLAAFSCGALILLFPLSSPALDRVLEHTAGIGVQRPHDAEDKRPVVDIALFETFGPRISELAMADTLVYLRDRLPQYHFKVQVYPGLDPNEVLKEKNFKFFISSAGIYSELASSNVVRHIATGTMWGADNPAQSTASAIIVRNDRKDLQTLADLKGKTAAASQYKEFSGWKLAMGEIAKQGYDWRKFFRRCDYLNYQVPDVVSAVLAGTSDAGLIAACTLEYLEKEGIIEKGELRVINDKSIGYNGHFTCRRSSDLYPGVVFASVEGAPADIVRDITVTVLTMPKTKRNWNWSVASDFAAVDRLNRTLKIGQYSYMNDFSLAALWMYHKNYFLAALALIIVLVLHEFFLQHQVRRKTEKLSVALQEKEAAELESKKSREMLSAMERAGVISQLSSMIAHELRQPLTAILNYANGLEAIWKTGAEEHGKQTEFAVGRMKAEAGRANEIVDHVRAYAKHQEGPLKRMNLSEATNKAIRTFERNNLQKVILKTDIEDGIWVMGHELELELLGLNIMKNAAHAALQVNTLWGKKPWVKVSLKREEKCARLVVTDNGPKISDEDFMRLTTIQESVKPDGLGLGLGLVRNIADRHAASLEFIRGHKGGITVQMKIGLADGEDGEESKEVKA